MTQPFDTAWLERELNRSTRSVLWVAGILVVFFLAGTIVSVNRGWRTEWPAILVLTLLAGLPGLWFLKIGLAPSSSHPLLVVVRDNPSLIESVTLEWRGGGKDYWANLAIRLGDGRHFRMRAPKGREEELANWIRTVARPTG